VNRDHFLRQLDRLKKQWPNSYGDERSARIWAVFKDLDDGTFVSMVDTAIDRMRQAPLAEDLSRLEAEVRNRDLQNRVSSGLGGPSFAAPLQQAARKSSADPDFVKACLKLLRDKDTGRNTMAQFLEGCDALDQLARQLEPRGRSHYGGNKFYERTSEK